MFSVATRILTLIGVLVHAGFGCCAHHQHCDASGGQNREMQQQSTRVERITCSCRHHHHHETAVVGEPQSRNLPSEHCPCGHEDAGCSDHCRWLTTEQVKVASRDSVLFPVVLANQFLPHDVDPDFCRFRTDEIRGPSHCAVALRAATQVWQL